MIRSPSIWMLMQPGLQPLGRNRMQTLTVHFGDGSLGLFLTAEGDEAVALRSASVVVPHDTSVRASRAAPRKGLKQRSVIDLHVQAVFCDDL